jgi:hypothetical protein
MNLARYTVMGLVVSMLVSGCRQSGDLQGAWSGTLDNGKSKQRLVLKISRNQDAYTATLDAIDLGRRDLPVTAIRVRGTNVHVELAAFDAIYRARLNVDAMRLSGVLKQPGATHLLVLNKTAHPPKVPEPLLPSAYKPRAGSDLQGYWTGTISTPGVPQRIAFKISEPSSGKFRAELDNFAQGTSNIPVTSLAYKAHSVRMNVNGVAGVFEGELNAGAGEIIGTWKQGPNTGPLTLKRELTK